MGLYIYYKHVYVFLNYIQSLSFSTHGLLISFRQNEAKLKQTGQIFFDSFLFLSLHHIQCLVHLIRTFILTTITVRSPLGVM